MNESPRVLGNRYEIGDLLGRGGMAEVHIGRDTRLGRTVAIKLLRTDLARDSTFQARFRREAQSAAGLNHPAIVAVYDTGEESLTDSGGGQLTLPYIVMEYVHGRTLRDMLEEAKARAAAAVGGYGADAATAPLGSAALDVTTALEVTSGVLSALEYSHRAGIVHRDIKPANVMVTSAGDIKVMDFGIARAMADASAAMTQTQAVIGTAQYLSPEQARGETVDARSDLYSTGCMLFELLTGRPPFVADSPVAVAYQHVREFPQPPSSFNPAVPESVDRIVMHALTKDRDIRYQTAEEFRSDVDSVRLGRGVNAPVVVPPAAQSAATEYLGTAGATRMMSPMDGAGTMLPGSTGPGAFPGESERTAYVRPRDDRPDRRGVGYALLTLAVIGVFALVFWVVSKAVSSGTPGTPPTTAPSTAAPAKVTVPDETGKLYADAKADLEARNLQVQQGASAPETADIKAGHVLSQDPEHDSVVNAGDMVTLVVAAAPEQVIIPLDIQGKSCTDAVNALHAAGLANTNSAPVDVYDPKFPGKDITLATEPKIGSSVDPGQTVTVKCSSGFVVVPDLSGKTLNEATKALDADGLSPNPNWVDNSEPANNVVGQDPAPNQRVAVGTAVNIDVSKGTVPTTTTQWTDTAPPTTDTTAPTTSTTDSTPPGQGNH